MHQGCLEQWGRKREKTSQIWISEQPQEPHALSLPRLFSFYAMWKESVVTLSLPIAVPHFL